MQKYIEQLNISRKEFLEAYNSDTKLAALVNNLKHLIIYECLSSQVMESQYMQEITDLQQQLEDLKDDSDKQQSKSQEKDLNCSQQLQSQLSDKEQLDQYKQPILYHHLSVVATKSYGQSSKLDLSNGDDSILESEDESVDSIEKHDYAYECDICREPTYFSNVQFLPEWMYKSICLSDKCLKEVLCDHIKKNVLPK